MNVKSRRLEKRERLIVPVTISSLGDPGPTDQTNTENVSSKGMRALTWLEKKKEERVEVRFLNTDQRILARVVYCQRLSDGRFGIGLEFRGAPVRFPEVSMAAASD